MFHEYAFIVSWNAVSLLLTIPSFFLIARTRWEYRGKRDRLRTNVLFLASISFFIEYLFQVAYWADILATFDYRIAEHYAAQAALDAISELFSLMGLLSLAFIFLRTAIALLYDLSGGAKPGLARIVNLAGGAGLAVLIILAIIVWAVFVWYLDRIGQEDVSSPELQNAFYAFEKIAVAYEWIYFAFATIYLPIVFLQVLGGHRTDKIAMLLYTFAILLVDTLHVIEVVGGLVAIHERSFLSGSNAGLDLGLEVGSLVCESLFYLGALYCLAIMGMRDPKRLTGEDEQSFTPIKQHWQHDSKADPEANHSYQGSPSKPSELAGEPERSELMGKETNEGPQELPDNGIDAELPGENEVKPGGKLTRLFDRRVKQRRAWDT